MRLPEGGDPCQHAGERAKVPAGEDTFVYKTECTQCFASVDDPAGLLVCATCFNGGCDEHATLHATKTGHCLALRLRRTPKPKKEEEAAEGAAGDAEGSAGEKKLRIEAVDTESAYDWAWEAVCRDCGDGAWISVDRSDARLAATADAVLAARSAAQAQGTSSWEAPPLIQCEHTVALAQPEKSAAPQLAAKSLAHCAECDVDSNLWLCMTCGHLGCGRRNWDGSGANNHAVDHADSTGHAVVVKMGTITAEGTADVHCYKCDEERLDPLLAEHFATFGIDIATQKKTDKTLAEMQYDLNTDPALFSRSRENGAKVKNLYGAGKTGLENLGNTCYMNSVLQVAFALPEFQQRYFGEGGAAARQHIAECPSASPATCYGCQMHKLAAGLLSGDHSKAPDAAAAEGSPSATGTKAEDEDEDEPEQEGIPPRMLKHVLCGEHPEFRTAMQQDAEEFLGYMLEQVRRRERRRSRDPTTTFDFELQERLQCMSCKKVRYTSMPQQILSLPIDAEAKIVDPEAQAVAEAEEERIAEGKKQAAARAAAREAAQAAAKAAEGAESGAKEGDGGGDGEEKGGDDDVDKKGDDQKKDAGPPEREDLARLERAAAVPLSACVAKFAKAEALEFKCSDCGSSEGALKTTRVSRFPTTLAVQMQRFTLEDWVPRKVGFQIRLQDGESAGAPMKEDTRVELDFESLRGVAEVPASGEELMKDSNPADGGGAAGGAGAGAGAPQLNQEAIVMLEGMGFPKVRAERAVHETGGASANAEAAMEWLLAHMEDADIDTPLAEILAAQGGGGGGGGSGSGGSDAGKEDEGALNPEAIVMLEGMGFDKVRAERAVFETGGKSSNAEVAMEWLLAHMEDADIDTPLQDILAARKAADAADGGDDGEADQAAEPAGPDTAPAKYELMGWVEHRGSSTRSGHYVAYVRIDGKWVHFNDRRVTETLAPPSALAYMYFFRRVPAT